jgi:hypothetical protein
VLAIVDTYIKQSLTFLAELPLFEETKKIADLSFQEYEKVPEQEENTIGLATELLFAESPELLLKDAYSKTVTYHVNLAQVKSVVE